MDPQACPAEEQVLRYLSGKLDPDSRDTFDRHLDTCPNCLQLVVELARTSFCDAAPPAASEPPTVPEPQPAGAQVPAHDAQRALQPGQRVGRYTLLAIVGRGGMGVVWAAYDPELDRRVALKFIRTEAWRVPAAEAQDALRQEARAMARLSHPNAVTVHDVGTHAGDVFLAMEYVAGTTLRGWLAQAERPWQEVVRIYRRAGEGLAAAHAAGLVHRDFKPENVLIGADGRPRVTDFGLARLAREPSGDGDPDRSTGPAGTPLYMAPEQQAGKVADQRADQFSFCVALWEALFGAHPFHEAGRPEPGQPTARARGVPQRIRAALRKGMSEAPAERFADLDALLERLQPSRSWLWVAAAVLAVGAVLLPSWLLTRDPCAGVADGLERVWGPQQRQRLDQAFAESGRVHSGETFTRFAERLDAYSQTWSGMRVAACQATRVDNTQSDSLMDLRMACLDERLEELGALVAVFSAGVSAEEVDRAMRAVAGLTDLQVCADRDRLQAQVPMPGDPAAARRVERARLRLAEGVALMRAGRLKPSVQVLAGVLSEARRMGYTPLEAKALCWLGSAHNELGDAKKSEGLLYDCALKAAEARDDETAAVAWSRLVAIVGHTLGKPDEGLKMAKMGEAALARAGSPPGATARLAFHKALVLMDAGKLAEAQAEARRSLAIWTAGPAADDIEAANVLNLLGKAAYGQGDYAGSLAKFEQALALRRRTLGPKHPWVIDSMQNVAVLESVQGELAEALVSLEATLKVAEETLGPEHPRISIILNNLGGISADLGRPAEAVAPLRRALAIREKSMGPDHPDTALTLSILGYTLYLTRSYDEALPLLQRSAAIREKALGADHPAVAEALGKVADVYSAQRKWDDSLAARRRTIRILKKSHGPDHPDVATAVCDLGLTLKSMERWDEAVEQLNEAQAIWQKILGPEDPQNAYAQLGLAEVELGRDRPARAVPLAERAVALRQASQMDPTLLANARFVLAQALWDSAGDRDRARSLATAARDAWATLGERGAADSAEAAAWLKQRSQGGD